MKPSTPEHAGSRTEECRNHIYAEDLGHRDWRCNDNAGRCEYPETTAPCCELDVCCWPSAPAWGGTPRHASSIAVAQVEARTRHFNGGLRPIEAVTTWAAHVIAPSILDYGAEASRTSAGVHLQGELAASGIYWLICDKVPAELTRVERPVREAERHTARRAGDVDAAAIPGVSIQVATARAQSCFRVAVEGAQCIDFSLRCSREAKVTKSLVEYCGSSIPLAVLMEPA